jgi:predicted nucleic acid-binding protein
MIVVSDTSAISNLAEVRQLELLQKLYGELVIPCAVYQELLNTDKNSLTASAIDGIKWIKVQSITNNHLLDNLNLILDQGEAEAITLALEIQAERIIIDERKGRNEALKLGLKVTGILGVLIAAKKQGFIVAVKPILDQLRASEFWVRKELYLETLRLAGEI